MNTFSPDYYDLVSRGLEGVPFQTFVDELFSKKYSTPNASGFKWDPSIQNDFTYNQLQIELGIPSMATYVDLDSPGPYKSGEGFEVRSGSIPRMKHGFTMNEKAIREHMLMLQETGRLGNSASDGIRRLLFDSLDKLITGNHSSIAFQRNQIVSKGSFEILDANNPQGIKNVKIPFLSDEHISDLKTTARWFTDNNGTEGTTSDPIKDLKDLKRKAGDFAPAMHLEMDRTLFEALINHKKVRTIVGMYTNVGTAMTDEQYLQQGKMMFDDAVKTALERIIGLKIVVVDMIGVVEKYDSSEKKVKRMPLRGFEPDTVALVPDGELGTILAVRPLQVSDPAARIATFDGGRTLITQTFDARRKIQYIESELTALCVPKVAQHMYVLRVK